MVATLCHKLRSLVTLSCTVIRTSCNVDLNIYLTVYNISRACRKSGDPFNVSLQPFIGRC
jgi:hypothetical protein